MTQGRPAALDALDISAEIDMRPHDADAVARYAQALRSSVTVLEEFAGDFDGEQSPVHLFWHSSALAHARFSGRRAAVATVPVASRQDPSWHPAATAARSAT